MENDHGPGQDNRKWLKTVFEVETMYKYFHCLIQMKTIESMGIET